jgi:hypothetical protein
MCNLVSQNVLHRNLRDVVIDGHFIPKGTCIVPQISAVLYDDDVSYLQYDDIAAQTSSHKCLELQRGRKFRPLPIFGLERTANQV